MSRIVILGSFANGSESIGVYCELLGYETHFSEAPSFCSVCNSSHKKCQDSTPCADFLIIDKKLTSFSAMELIELQLGGGCKVAPQRKAVIADEMSPGEFKLAKSLGYHVLQKPVTYEILENWLVDMEWQTVGSAASVNV
jgi:hypothetical protein